MTWKLFLARRWPISWLAVPSLVGLWGGVAAGAEGKVQFNRDIRPILSETCFKCHGPDGGARKANLRLDRRDAALKAGVITPKDLDNSSFVDRIDSEEQDVVMPPPDSNKVLTADQRALLKRWIQEGAEYQEHWAFIAPVRPQPPEVKDAAWVKTPIDRFILAGLESKGLKPAPEADRRTLARRLSLDLTGLPPDAAEVEAFVKDARPDAYEALVDRYLASPRYGEHRARYWLDAARYADSHGIHFDNYREVWSYRDWVIAAFNRNLPFDQFTVEQLAGDLLPNHSTDQEVASGFNRNNITTNEGGAISEEYAVLYTRDRTETAAQTFLGLTAGCAVCHDHKFDPLSQREFYELSAFFNNTTQAAMDGNIKDTPPVLFLPAAADKARWAAIPAEKAKVQGEVEARRKAARAEFDASLAAATPDSVAASRPTEGRVLRFPMDSRDLAKVPPREPGPAIELPEVGDFERDKGFTVAAWVKPSKGDVFGALVARMDDAHDFRGWDLWIEGGRVGSHIIHKWPEDAIKAVSKNPVPPGVWSHVLVSYDGSSKVGGIKVFINGVAQETMPTADKLTASIRTTVPLKVGQRHTTSRTLEQTLIHDVQVFSRSMAPPEVAKLVRASQTADLVTKLPAARPAAEVEALFTAWLAAEDAPSQALGARAAGLATEEAAIKKRGATAFVMHEKTEPASAFVLFRGDYDKRREQVQAGTPKILPPMSPDLPRNRLASLAGSSGPSIR